MRKKIFFILVLFSISSFSQSGFAKTDIEFLLDLSGSMRKVADGETQIETARQALAKALANIQGDTQTALRVYGHRVEQTNKAESCKDTELVVPFAADNHATIKSKMAALEPKGFTPIAYSLEQSKNDFSLTREAKKVIILLSDGEETCDGDPIAVLKKLKEEGFELVVHAIGFNVDAKTREQLEAIADFTGGKYFDAQGASQLSEALKEATQEAVLIEKEKTTYGEAIRGGDSYETAVALPLNKELKLDHHQKAKEYDYFYVDLEAGQEASVTLKTLEVGVHIGRDGQTSEGGAPYGGMQFHNNERKKLRSEVLIAAKHGSKIFNISIPEAQRYYLLIGNDYESQHKDHVTFQVAVTTKGDLGSDQDAGDQIQNAMPILPGRYEKNHLGGADKEDTFSFSAKKGETFRLGLIPNEDINVYFQIVVWDDFKQQLAKFWSKTQNSGLKSEPFSIPEDGTYFFQVGVSAGHEDAAKSYTLIFERVEEKATNENTSN